MFTHILITLDGSPRSEAVIPHATDIARSMCAQLTLLRVVDPAGAEWGERGAMGRSGAESTLSSLFAEQARAYLERTAAEVAAGGVMVRTIVKQGSPAKQIIHTAREIDADAIAMATRGRRGLGRLMFASVAGEVIHESAVPVLVVRAA